MKIICIARNYAAHAAELHRAAGWPAGWPAERAAGGMSGGSAEGQAGSPAGGSDVGSDVGSEKGSDVGSDKGSDAAAAGPAEPVWFLKPDTALLRNNDPFYIPAFSQEVHYECELIVRICRMGRAISERFAHRYYDEVGLGIDFTARDLQRQAIAEGLPWERAKAFDRSAAVSPAFVPLAELGGDVQRLRFTLEVNGEVRQTGDTADMIFPVDRLIAAVSQFTTLRMGDLLFTGTPAGVGPVRPGDNLRGMLCGRELLNFDIR